MKNVLFATLAFVGFSALSVGSAMAQNITINNADSSRLTGAAVTQSMDGAISAIAGETVFPKGIYASDIKVAGTYTGNASSTDFGVNTLDVSGTAGTSTAMLLTLDEAMGQTVYTTLGGTPNFTAIDEVVSLVRAYNGLN